MGNANGFDYISVKQELNESLAMLVFVKKNGDIRPMLATRSNTLSISYGEDVLSKLKYYDERNNKKNGNIAVVDMEINDVRSFNIGRLISISPYSIPKSKKEYGDIFKDFKEQSRRILDEAKDKFKKTNAVDVDIFDDLTPII